MSSLFFSFFNMLSLYVNNIYFLIHRLTLSLKNSLLSLKTNGMFFLRNLAVILFIDTLVIDDEPLWEPTEWTLVQTWVLFIFFFSWIAETLISSKYGSFTGRDKRVYQGLFRGYWYSIGWFAFNILLTVVFVATPFYFELNYTVSSVVTWWNWYNRLFFYKISICFFFIFLILLSMQLGLRWLNWSKLFFLSLVVFVLLSFIFYTQFIVVFFSYFTDMDNYSNNAFDGYSALSQGPLRWGWGSREDTYSYHQTPGSFWNKNDGLYSSSLFLINIFIFLLLVMTLLQWILFVRRMYSTKDMSYTFLTYASSNIRNFFYSLMFLALTLLVSVFYQYLRTPLELYFFDMNWVEFFEVVKFTLCSYLEFLSNLAYKFGMSIISIFF